MMDSGSHGTFQVLGNRPATARHKKLEILREIGVWTHIMSISAETKQELILASFRGEVSIADLCRRAQVPESTFRDWRDRFLAAGTAALQTGETAKGGGEKEAVVHEKARLKTGVAGLSGGNTVFKKRRNGASSLASI